MKEKNREESNAHSFHVHTFPRWATNGTKVHMYRPPTSNHSQSSFGATYKSFLPRSKAMALFCSPIGGPHGTTLPSQWTPAQYEEPGKVERRGKKGKVGMSNGVPSSRLEDKRKDVNIWGFLSSLSFGLEDKSSIQLCLLTRTISLEKILVSWNYKFLLQPRNFWYFCTQKSQLNCARA